MIKAQRLQGKAFEEVKNEYRLKTFIVHNGNVKAFLVHKISGWKITHWLNDAEKLKFKNSEYIKNCYRKKKPMADGITYRYGYVKPCNIQSFDLNIKFDPELIKIHSEDKTNV